MDIFKRLFKKNEDQASKSFEICYTCNECFQIIEDGSPRYQCVECEDSYDLCKKCFCDGKGKKHMEDHDINHSFVMETQSVVAISKCVYDASTLEQLILNMFKYYEARPAIGQYDKDSNSFKFTTFGEIFKMVNHFSAGLRKLMSSVSCGLDSTISMCSVSRLEWYLTDLACLFLSLTTVPLGTTIMKDQMKFILKKAEVSVLVCSLKTLEDSLLDILSDCTNLKLLILMDIALTDQEVMNCTVQIPENIQLVYFSEVLDSGKKSKEINFSEIKHNPTDMFTVQFTSGSTGEPKGCVFTRTTWKTRISKGAYMGYLGVWVSYHPPSHNLERKSFYVTLLNGGKIGIYRGAMEHLLNDFALVRPTIIASTPRLWTTMYNQYLKELHKAFINHQRKMATAAELSDSDKLSINGSNVSLEHFDPDQVPQELVDEVMSKFKSKLGGRERMITTGGAATAPAVLKFIIHCFKGMVNDGYGSTEVGGIASDGHLFSHNEVKLIDVPEMGYLTTDNPPRGEICVKTPEMIDSYFKNPEATAEKFVDGYFLTGDIGMIDESGKVKIIDRKKNIFKLSQGEFVSPESLENLYSGSSHYINQIYIYGNSLHSNVLAVVVPDETGIHQVAKSLGIEDKDMSSLCGMDTIKDAYMKELQTIARKQLLPGWEVPLGVIMEPEPFSPENGLLTSTMKASRPSLEKKYRSMLEGLYVELDQSTGQRPLEIIVFEEIKKELLEKEMGPQEQQQHNIDILEKSFTQLGGDSLSAMQLSSLLNEHLKVDVPAEVILKIPVKELLTSLKSGISLEKYININPGFDRKKFLDWQNEASLNDLLEWMENNPCCCSLDSTTTEKASCVLLTGSTGFLGRFILHELLINTTISKVYCLIQGKDDATPHERMLKLLHQMSVEMNNEEAIKDADKIVVVAGNLAEEKLGLSSEDYDLLCKSVDTIIHNGAVVNSALPYLALKTSNVSSTKELIKMAVLEKPKFLHYVSTIGVYPFMSVHVDESIAPPVERLNGLSGYSQSKWVSESLVMAAIKKSRIRGSISRPGLIGPHSITGQANLQDWVCWLVKGLVRLGMMPTGRDGEQKVIHWVPVDQVAKAVVLISCGLNKGMNGDPSNLIFHLVNSTSPTPFTALTSSLATRHPSIKATSYEEFRRTLTEMAKLSGDIVLGKVDLLLPHVGGWPMSPVYYSQEHKVKLFKDIGIELDQLHSNYVDMYLNYLLEH